MIATAVALLSLAVWAYLLVCRGWFWLCGERDDAVPLASDAPAAWPAVVAIIPARDEADMIAHSVGSLLLQDYRGPFSVVVVDDQSADGTGGRRDGCGKLGRRGRPAADRCRNQSRARLDGKTMGDAPGPLGDRARRGGARVRALQRRGHRLCPPRADAARGDRPGEKERPCLADGEAALRKRGRAMAGSGLRFLLPDALPLRLG